MIHSIRHFIETRLGIVMGIAFLAGLFVPRLELISGAIVPWLIAVIIFLSCTKIHIDDIRQVRFKEALLFYILRFLLLPFGLYGLALYIVPSLSSAILLVALLPVGSMVPTLSGICGGNVALAMGLTIISSLAAPFTIPFAFAFVGGADIRLDIWAMFISLALTIFVPVLVYFMVVRKVEPLKIILRRNSSAASILLISLAIIIVVAKKRDVFLGGGELLLENIIIQFVLFGLFYLLAWFYGHIGRRFFVTNLDGAANRRVITFILASGAMNIALGISLGFQFFSPEVVAFIVLGEIPWILILAFYRKIIHH